MMRGIEKTYSKPNMANLHGRMGAQILRRLRQQTVKAETTKKEEFKKEQAPAQIDWKSLGLPGWIQIRMFGSCPYSIREYCC